jgi:hypothetical protein
MPRILICLDERFLAANDGDGNVLARIDFSNADRLTESCEALAQALNVALGHGDWNPIAFLGA